jgi:dTDP-glucose 4,6-dehydratase
MKILITGGLGFIGSNFTRRFSLLEYDLVVIDKISYASDISQIGFYNDSKVEFKKNDISNVSDLREIFKSHGDFDIVVNFAAESHVDRSITNPENFIYSNVIGVYNLLTLQREGLIDKFIQISTDEVYGSIAINEKSERWTESTKIDPRNPYSATKASAELICNSFRNTYDSNIIITRSSNNFGPFQSVDKLIPKIIFHAANNRRIPIYGRGSQIREWIYVDDNCQAIENIIINKPSANLYNLGGTASTNLNLTRKILELMDKSEELIEFVKDRAGHDFQYSLNSELYEQEFNHNLDENFVDKLEKTVLWYQNNYRWMEESYMRIIK